MMRALWVLGFVVLPLAGCLDDDAASVQEQAGAGWEDEALPDVGLVEYADCMETGAVVAVPAEEIRPGLPEGFDFVPMDPAGGTAALVVAGISCAEATAGEALGPVQEMIGLLPVTVPDRYAAQGVASYAVLFAGMIDDATLHEVYASWGFPEDSFTIATGITVEGIGDAPVGRAGHALGDDGTWTVETHAGLAGQTSTGEAAAVRGFVVSDGTVVAIIDATYTEFTIGGDGTGTLTVQGGDLPDGGAGFGFRNHGFGMTFEAASLPPEEGHEDDEGPASPMMLWRGVPLPSEPELR